MSSSSQVFLFTAHEEYNQTTKALLALAASTYRAFFPPLSSPVLSATGRTPSSTTATDKQSVQVRRVPCCRGKFVVPRVVDTRNTRDSPRPRIDFQGAFPSSRIPTPLFHDWVQLSHGRHFVEALVRQPLRPAGPSLSVFCRKGEFCRISHRGNVLWCARPCTRLSVFTQSD